jgi:hypothetical protein
MRHVKPGIILLTVVAVGVGALLLRDYLSRKRAFAQRTACVGSLIRIRLTKEFYAQEHSLTNGATISENDVWRENGHVERCFSGGRYSINPVGVYPSCSYTGVVRWRGQLWSHKWGPPE